MGFLRDFIADWLREILVNGILANLGGLFDTVNDQIVDITVQVGTPPNAWHPGVFSLIQNLSETVVLPIAGVILTFIATYELIQLILEKNNLQEVDTWIFFKWVFKTFVAVIILSNTFTAIIAIFEVAQSVANSAGGLIGDSAAITPEILDAFRYQLMEMDLGPLIGLWLQSFIVQITSMALGIIVFVIVYGRMVEIFVLTSLAPIPFATLSSREFGSMGQNYVKALCALAFQGFLILVCIAIYAVMVQGIVTSDDPIGAIWLTLGYTVLLCFTLFKTGSVAKSIFGTH